MLANLGLLLERLASNGQLSLVAPGGGAAGPSGSTKAGDASDERKRAMKRRLGQSLAADGS
jgi:hypothetical protein